ncbi:MAG: hypothetical protein PHR44_04755 [Candidatus Omnitrophica bacterium]|nr:hypothetical protein [Candidatus Omnitrophota bacterium]
MSGTLRLGLFISLLWHGLCPLIFDTSFKKAYFAKQEPVVFLGSILSRYSPEPKAAVSSPQGRRLSSHRLPALDSIMENNLLAVLGDKPRIQPPSYLPRLESALNPVDTDEFFKERRGYQKALFFHPRIPYHFLLYFKDRASVHIELEFFLSAKGDALEVRRRVSSGNLDADLLVWRHINHWLFLRREQLPRNLWQTVKIDLAHSAQEQ